MTIAPVQIEPLIIDFIKANRYIQSQYKTTQTRDFLGIATQVSNKQLEAQLLDVLVNHNLSDTVIRHYLNIEPKPSNPESIINLIVRQFNTNLQRTHIKYDLVRAGINRLLHINDYSNCFSLLDQTLRSDKYLSFVRQNLRFNSKLYSGIFVLMNLLSIGILDFPIETLLFNTIFSGSIIYGFLGLKFPKHLGRISFRNSNSLSYNIIHNQELLMMNRILSYFEEYNEVNLLNYHYSQIRNFNNLNLNKLEDYIVEEPQGTEIISYKETNDFKTEEIIHLQSLFRNEFKVRKIVLNDLPQELNFLEFWSNSERFQWVEPDQDPAEVRNFR